MCKVEITLEQAKKLYPNASMELKSFFEDNFGKLQFKKFHQNITERIKSFQDVLDETGESIEKFNKRISDLSRSEKAYVKLKLIAKVLNESWIPDFNNNFQPKYYIWWRFDESKNRFVLNFCDNNSNTYSTVGVHLSLKSQEITSYFASQFEEEWNEFLSNEE